MCIPQQYGSGVSKCMIQQGTRACLICQYVPYNHRVFVLYQMCHESLSVLIEYGIFLKFNTPWGLVCGPKHLNSYFFCVTTHFRIYMMYIIIVLDMILIIGLITFTGLFLFTLMSNIFL